jgi:protein SCO1
MDRMKRWKKRGSRARSFVLLLCAAAASLAPATARTCAAQCASHMGHTHDKQTQDEKQAQERQSFTRAVASYEPPDVTLLDMNGGRVSLTTALNYEGPVFLQFIFTTCPTVCPVMSGTFSAAQERLGADLARVRMISISIDPDEDTPERLREYARRFKAGRQWLFLTGDLDDIVAVQKSFDAYRGDKMRHEPLTFLRAAPGKTWVRLDGLMSAAQLVAEYRRLTSQ